MRKTLLVFLLPLLFPAPALIGQSLPVGLTDDEAKLMPEYLADRQQRAVQTDPPAAEVRTPAEWEPHQALYLSWTGYPEILREIVREARTEMTVVINTGNANSTANYLTSGGVDLDNVEFVDYDYNSIWIRDYGPWTIYENEVEDIGIVDWVYNRPRPQDDDVPVQIAGDLGYPFYETAGTNRLVGTGGNFMTDGLGRGFSSELIIEENPTLSLASIENRLADFMGIDEYVLMPMLPFDGIHHIDMHMKLLDEETILMGEYPTGVADGPQIEANLAYVLENYNSPFGTPYKVVRMEMPPDQFDDYPDSFGYYRTFTNSVFVNRKLIVPIYEERYDTTALRIYRENLPGYEVVGIDCNDIIPASGAIHCITKMVGVEDPLWMVHQPLREQVDNDAGYLIETMAKHRTDIAAVTVFYREAGETDWQTSTLTPEGDDLFSTVLPALSDTTQIEYYLEGVAGDFTIATRPITAPEGFYTFDVRNSTPTSLSGIEELDHSAAQLTQLFPNPSRGMTVVEGQFARAQNIKVQLFDLLGRSVELIHDGPVSAGSRKFFFDSSTLSSGIYTVELIGEAGNRSVRRVVVQ